ncbi:sensor histidine kinase [Acrocarpospora catenulata]|uniref:sensor histidine kinase n=1 Tax=Acrocarpospora catenulata TaxID=2836182 RepID=UPI001BD9E82D|nr:histidine kinase [Acrocarpospora catenulata]
MRAAKPAAPEARPMSQLVRIAAVAVAVVSLVLTATAVVLGAVNDIGLFGQSHLVFVAAAAIVGGLINVHRPGNAIGLLLAALGLCFALLDAFGQLAIKFPEVRALAWPQTWLWIPANMAVAAIPLFFPSGHLASPRWRPVLWAFAGLAVLAAIASALLPGPNDQAGYGTAVVNPLGVPALAEVGRVAELGFPVLAGLLFVAGAADLARRSRGATGAERAQVQWLVYAVALAGLIVVGRLVAGLRDDVPDAIWPIRSPFWELAGGGALTLVLVAIGVAVLRHRLFDIDLVINRTLVYAVLSGFVTGGYVLIVGYLGAVFHQVDALPLSIVAAGLVAVVFAPLRARVQRGVNLLMYGRREDPYAVLARRLEETTEDLRRSRERLVLAREEERRRIRNDLHDGLGPTLAALTMRAEAVQDLVGEGPARDLLEEIITDAETAASEVRAMIDGLRPPALDSLGLVRALSSHVAGLPGGFRVSVDAPAELPRLPAATEVAAYHIAVEALTNVWRHAGATSAWLSLSADRHRLTVEVADDGVGPHRGRAGVGTISMRDRAAELGGTCTIEPRREGGTRVLAVLPAEEGTHGTDPRAAR